MSRKFFFLMLLIPFTALNAQKKNYFLFYSPQFLFVNAIKLDLEIRKEENKNRSLLLSPYIQLGKTNVSGGASHSSPDEPYNYYSQSIYPDDLVGLGLHIQNKLYLLDGKPEDSKHFPYLCYGVSYLFSKISYEYRLRDNYELKSGVDKFNIFGIQTTMGDRIEIGHAFLLDLYAGIGIKYTDKSTTALGVRDYARNIFDYGYTGIHPTLGMRIGFKL